MALPRVLVLRCPGTNCDTETKFAFTKLGAPTDLVHLYYLQKDPQLLHKYQILVLPGGFSYGDDVAAGKILANQLITYLGDELKFFRDQEKLILGICNGFQTLLKTGLLLQNDVEDGPLATLAPNQSGKFEARWVNLRVVNQKSPFLTKIDQLYLPVAHGEGNFICRKEWILRGLKQTSQIALQYVDSDGRAPLYPGNPNGSQEDIAGICDITGRVFGLMPHPERHILPTQNPHWTRLGLKNEGDGLAIFRNAVDFFRKD